MYKNFNEDTPLNKGENTEATLFRLAAQGIMATLKPSVMSLKGINLKVDTPLGLTLEETDPIPLIQEEENLRKKMANSMLHCAAYDAVDTLGINNSNIESCIKEIETNAIKTYSDQTKHLKKAVKLYLELYDAPENWDEVDQIFEKSPKETLAENLSGTFEQSSPKTNDTGYINPPSTFPKNRKMVEKILVNKAQKEAEEILGCHQIALINIVDHLEKHREISVDEIKEKLDDAILPPEQAPDTIML